MAVPAVGDYDARWGYRAFDARRYERRRYGGLGGRLRFALLARALRRALADVPSGSLVLDVPCGTGIVGSLVAGLGHRVVGLDISPAMLGVARERGDARGHVRADLEALPVQAGVADAVVCVRFLMHLPAEMRPRVLAGLAQVTHGPVVATVCHPYTWKTFQRSVRRAFGGAVKRSPRIGRAALEAEVKAAGLRLERVIATLPLFSEVWVIVVRR